VKELTIYFPVRIHNALVASKQENIFIAIFPTTEYKLSDNSDHNCGQETLLVFFNLMESFSLYLLTYF